jgi:two-component system, NtrC family, nitrogen regulation response regulator NtrX
MTHTVLIVDDDAGIRETLRAILEDEGYSVLEAADGIAGLALLASDCPQLLLLDLNMPRLNGWEMYAAMQARGAAVPTVIMTAGYGAAEEAARLGARGSLAKPFDLDEVLRTVLDLTAVV